MEETGVSVEYHQLVISHWQATDLPQVTDKFYHIMCTQRKPLTWCKSLTNHLPATSHWQATCLPQVTDNQLELYHIMYRVTLRKRPACQKPLTQHQPAKNHWQTIDLPLVTYKLYHIMLYEVPRENNQPAASHWHMKVVSSTPHHVQRNQTNNFSGDRHWSHG
jgi:hypothetical protein